MHMNTYKPVAAEIADVKEFTQRLIKNFIQQVKFNLSKTQ